MPPSILLITSIANHYQIAFGEAFYRLLGDRFRLAICQPVPAERGNWGGAMRARGCHL